MLECLKEDSGTFENKLKELKKKGILSQDTYTTLSIALEAGHAAMHRNYIPEKEDIIQVIDIVENLLHHYYILKNNAEILLQKLPKKTIKKNR